MKINEVATLGITESPNTKNLGTFLIQVSRNASSGKPAKKEYFMFDSIVSDWAQPTALSLKKKIDEHPITKRLRNEEGFDGPARMIAHWNDLDAEYNQAVRMLNSDKGLIPTAEIEFKKKVKTLGFAKKLIDSGDLLSEDTTVTEASESVVTVKNWPGDHANSWAVFVNGSPKWDGMSRREAMIRAKKEREKLGMSDKSRVKVTGYNHLAQTKWSVDIPVGPGRNDIDHVSVDNKPDAVSLAKQARSNQDSWDANKKLIQQYR